MYEHIDEVEPVKLREPLLAARERVLESRELMRIVRDLPVELDLEAARLGDYDRETVVRLFREYEFRTLIERLPPLSGEKADETVFALRAETADGSFPAAQVAGREPVPGAGAPAPNGRGPGGPGPGARRPSLLGEASGLQLSMDFDALGASGGRSGPALGSRAATRIVDAASLAALPAEDPRDALAALIADPGAGRRGRRDGRARSPVVARGAVGRRRRRCSRTTRGRCAGPPSRSASPARTGGRSRPRARPRPRRSDGCSSTSACPSWVTRSSGCSSPPPEPGKPLPDVAFDTQVAAYLINASLRSQTIADIVAEQLDLILPDPAGLDPAARVGLDALSAMAARPPLERALAAEHLDRLFAEIELPLIPVLAGMEAAGVAIDRDRLSALATEFGAEISRLEAEIYVDVGHEFNLGSPKQLEQVLFFELDLPKGKRTKTGYSTDASVLEDLRPAHPMIDKLLEWRTYTKLRSTYVEALPTLIAEVDGRLHTTFHQAVAATGRLSSSDPNLQNIPIRTELGRRIRRAFVAGGPDLVLVAADYSQIELRILAHVSGDEHLKEAFARNADIHRDTAARVLHKDPADVTADERSMAKMVNFGIAYGMSDFGLSTRANIGRKEAQDFINTYFATYSGISYYMLAIKEQARSQGFVTTLIGRRRHIPELAARNPSLRAAGERMAINMPIQGTAADIIKIAMIRLADRLRDEGLRARPLLQVHDELLLEVPRDEVDRLVPVLRETMEGAMPLDVPLTVDVKVGDDWEAMTPIPRGEAPAAPVAR